MAISSARNECGTYVLDKSKSFTKLMKQSVSTSPFSF